MFDFDKKDLEAGVIVLTREKCQSRNAHLSSTEHFGKKIAKKS